MPIEKVNTPVGRIVWGHPMKPQIKKDLNTNQPVLRDGQQVQQWAFGVAIPKAQFGALYQQMQQEALSAYPNGVPSNFSWKFKDGDATDRQGQPYSAREGWAGHYVLTISTEAFQPPCFKFENGQYRQLSEGEIKTGDYVVVNLDMKSNVPTNRTHTPGLYINPNAIELVGYGTEIKGVGGVDPTSVFGGQQHQLPPGASTTPVSGAPAGIGMPGTGNAPMVTPTAPAPAAMPQQAAPAPQMPAATGAYPSNPQPLPPPAHDFVNNAMGNPPTAPNAGMLPQQPTPPVAPSAAPATSYPSSMMPGMPPTSTQ